MSLGGVVASGLLTAALMVDPPRSAAAPLDPGSGGSSATEASTAEGVAPTGAGEGPYGADAATVRGAESPATPSTTATTASTSTPATTATPATSATPTTSVGSSPDGAAGSFGAEPDGDREAGAGAGVQDTWEAARALPVPQRSEAERRRELELYGDAESRRLVFAGLAGVGWAVIAPMPSAEVTVFVGSTLRPRVGWSGRSWRGAVGYEPTLSVGEADYAAAFLSFGGGYGLVYHRHHLSVLGYGGRSMRFHYSIGGGPLLWATTLTALEVEGRVGAVFHARRGRVRGLVGARARIVAVLGGYPIPQIGLFGGVAVW